MTKKLAPGMVLWFVPTDRRWQKPHEVTVAKVARRWATLEGYQGRRRIDVNTLHEDGAGFASPGRCWLSREAWEESERRAHLLHQLRNALAPWGGQPIPDSVTPDDVRQAAALLGIKLVERADG